MSCDEAMMQIDGYIAGTLSNKEIENFLEHVENCPDCYDELETIYTVSVAAKYLENEQVTAYNIPQMLKQDIERKKKHLKHRHILIRAACLGAGTTAAVVLLLLFVLV